MSKWRLAKSLERLRWEVNTLYPKRSKASDGAKGDAAHAKRRSDHNPLPNGVVCAIDITHDPKNGADMQAIADHILKYRHPALAYVIFNRSIGSQRTSWKWIRYIGKNPHTKHMHVSVVQDERYDIEGTWLKNFGQEEEPMPAATRQHFELYDKPTNVPMTTKLMVNDKSFETFSIDDGTIRPELFSLVKAINGVNGVKASLVWNAKTKTAKVTVRVDYEKIKMKLHVRSLNP